MLDPMTGSLFPSANVSFRVLGSIYFVVGVPLLPLLLFGSIFVFDAPIVGNVDYICRWIALLSVLGLPLAMLTGGVGIHVACNNRPLDLNGVAVGTLLPVGVLTWDVAFFAFAEYVLKRAGLVR